MELVRLKLEDIDEQRGVLAVRQGKGLKDRMVPIGERAQQWLVKYRDDIRPQLSSSDEERTLYLTRLGEPFSGSSMSALVRQYIVGAELVKSGSCHLFRHAMATAMHDHGADIRFIQALLGHSNLSTTEMYTRVSMEKLKEVHRRTHPASTNRSEAPETPKRSEPSESDSRQTDENPT
jgi:integrase/recombinase XerD